LSSFVTVTIHSAETGEEVLTTGPLSLDDIHNNHHDPNKEWTTAEIAQIVPCLNGHLIHVAYGVMVVVAFLAMYYRGTRNPRGNHKSKRQ